MGIRSTATMLAVFAAAGLTAPAPAGQDKKNARDPNEVVCEKQTIVGSRLATRRVCATRAEWAEKRRLDKEAIDLGQRSACMVTHNGPGGRPAC